MAMNARVLGIDKPCTLDWTTMTPAHGGRFCGDCKKVVRDLSKMTEPEARALVAKDRYGELCVRMLVDRDGNVFFGGDRLVSASLLSKAKRAAAATAAAAAAIALPFASSACSAIGDPLGVTSSEQETNPEDYEPLMGGVSAPDRPPVEGKADASDTDSSAADGAPAADAGPDVTIY